MTQPEPWLRGASSRRARICKKLPTTVIGLLVHIAEHAQRHVGQAVITAKLVGVRPRDTD